MKTLKYRSVMSVIVLSMLSVFLFTGCEKDTAVAPHQNDNNNLDKFKRLKFQTVITSSEDNGNFSDNSKKDSDFTEPSSGNGMGFTSTNLNNSNSFTDPRSSSNHFMINVDLNEVENDTNENENPQNLGSGFYTLKLDTSFLGEYSFKHVYCNSEKFSIVDFDEHQMNSDLVEAYIGLSGEYELSGDSIIWNQGSILYVFSYNGGVNLTNFSDPSSDSSFAAVLLIEYSGNFPDGNMLYSAEGRLSLTENGMTLSNVYMVDRNWTHKFDIDNAEITCN